MSTPFDASAFRHGTIRGSEDPRRSRTFEGRFGRMFRNLPPAEFSNREDSAPKPSSFGDAVSYADVGQKSPSDGDVLKRLAGRMFSPPAAVSDTADAPDFGASSEEAGLPAGYTYLGQFIDHDLTFDPVSSLQRDNDPEALTNYRTPRFDLDCVYGRGPDDQPYLYESDGVRMLLGEPLGEPRPDPEDFDLPRSSNGRAIIGDPRNDEHVIISQLHALFLRFHNRVADEVGASKPRHFHEVQRLVRWHYQWLILYDYLPRIVNTETYNEILPHAAAKSNPVKHPPKLDFFKPRIEAFIPVEFSGAAYRFGHSLVREIYRLNRSTDPNVGGPFKILSRDPRTSLTGHRRFRTDWVIDWSLFFKGISDVDEREVQRARLIDTSISDPLRNLPFDIAKEMPSLAERTLKRGERLELPSGQTVAKAMGVDPLTDDELFGPEVPTEFRENAPLWYYILAESAKKQGGTTLGPVGGRIVMETIVGLILQDGHSFLRQDPLWTPELATEGIFGIADFIRFARTKAQPRVASAPGGAG